MEKKWRLDLEVPDDINNRRKKLGKKWREVIYTGLDALEKASTDKPEALPPPIPPEEEYRNLLKRLFNLYKEK